MSQESDSIGNIIDLAQQLSVQQRSVDILKSTYQSAVDARDKLRGQLADAHNQLASLLDDNTQLLGSQAQTPAYQSIGGIVNTTTQLLGSQAQTPAPAPSEVKG